MRISYWLHLVGFVSLFALIGLFRNFYSPGFLSDMSCQQELSHPFLCGKKIPINQARVADISTIDGISAKGARDICQFMQGRKDARLEELIAIKGIGKAKLARLAEYFY